MMYSVKCFDDAGKDQISVVLDSSELFAFIDKYSHIYTIKAYMLTESD